MSPAARGKCILPNCVTLSLFQVLTYPVRARAADSAIFTFPLSCIYLKVNARPSNFTALIKIRMHTTVYSPPGKCQQRAPVGLISGVTDNDPAVINDLG